MINVAVSGAAGKMGQTVCNAVEGADDMALVGRADPHLGVSLQDVLGDADVVVDFTQPDQAVHNATLCLEAGVHCVMGTTGQLHVVGALDRTADRLPHAAGRAGDDYSDHAASACETERAAWRKQSSSLPTQAAASFDGS